MAAFKCKFINNSGSDLVVGCFGISNEATFRMTLSNGASFTTPPSMLIKEGERIVVGWDEFGENIVVFGTVMIDKKRKITIGPGGVTFVSASPIRVDDDPSL